MSIILLYLNVNVVKKISKLERFCNFLLQLLHKIMKASLKSLAKENTQMSGTSVMKKDRYITFDMWGLYLKKKFP